MRCILMQQRAPIVSTCVSVYMYIHIYRLFETIITLGMEERTGYEAFKWTSYRHQDRRDKEKTVSRIGCRILTEENQYESRCSYQVVDTIFLSLHTDIYIYVYTLSRSGR